LTKKPEEINIYEKKKKHEKKHANKQVSPKNGEPVAHARFFWALYM